MARSANARAKVADAPDGLDLVQEFLNTASFHADNPTLDILTDVAAAEEWLGERLAARGLRTETLEVAGLARLRRLRDSIRSTIRARDGRPDGPVDAAPESGEARLALRADGTVQLDSASPDGMSGLVLAEMLVAQARGTWPRLKMCALEPCSVAFYDRSRNTSARFHSPRCANYVNLHNSRDRRRAAEV